MELSESSPSCRNCQPCQRVCESICSTAPFLSHLSASRQFRLRLLIDPYPPLTLPQNSREGDRPLRPRYPCTVWLSSLPDSILERRGCPCRVSSHGFEPEAVVCVSQGCFDEKAKRDDPASYDPSSFCRRACASLCALASCGWSGGRAPLQGRGAGHTEPLQAVRCT